MKEIVFKRKVPIATITLICLSILGVFQVFMLAGGYALDAAFVKKTAPWFYDSFRKFVGEHPSTRPIAPDMNGSDSRATTIETVAGIAPDELSVTLDAAESAEIPTNEESSVLIPVSAPEKVDPMDSDEPMG